MGKVALIINEPNNCFGCMFKSFQHTTMVDKDENEYDAITDNSCMITNKTIDNCARKPQWCPLIPISENNEILKN